MKLNLGDLKYFFYHLSQFWLKGITLNKLDIVVIRGFLLTKAINWTGKI